MSTLILMFRNVLLFVALAVPGFLLAKKGAIKEAHSQGFSLLLTKAAFPIFIFSGTLNGFSFEKESLLLFVKCLIPAVLGIFLFALVVTVLQGKISDRKKRGTMQFCSIFPNNGLLGIPLAMAVLGESPVIPAMILMNILTNILVYTLGVVQFSGDKSKISVKHALFNPVMIAFLCGVLVQGLGLAEKVPEIGKFADYFGKSVTPLSMTVLGIKLASFPLKKIFLSAESYFVSFIKLVLCPVLVLTLVFGVRSFLPSFADDTILVAAFFTMAMPTAGLASSLAISFGGEEEDAAKFTLGTTLLCIITVPILYWALMLLV